MVLLFPSQQTSSPVSSLPAMVHNLQTAPSRRQAHAYEIYYSPVICGLHHLRVMVGGVNIPGSVFTVPMQPPSPETRGQPLYTIRGLKCPLCIAISGRGQVVVSEINAPSSQISIFSSELHPVMSVGSTGSGANQFLGPVGVAITDDDHILVADCFNHRIQVLTMEGQFLASVGTKGKGPLQFEFPVFILIHPNGQMFVSERDSNRIQVLNQDLTYSHSFTTHGPPREEQEGHCGMAVDSQGVVYVTDIRDNCIQKFSISGHFIGQFGSPGVGSGKLYKPFGIAIDDKDYVYISELTLQRISVFTSTGKFVQCFQVCDKDSDPENKYIHGFPKLRALAIDKSGNLYACMTPKGQVVIL